MMAACKFPSRLKENISLRCRIIIETSSSEALEDFGSTFEHFFVKKLREEFFAGVV